MASVRLAAEGAWSGHGSRWGGLAEGAVARAGEGEVPVSGQAGPLSRTWEWDAKWPAARPPSSPTNWRCSHVRAGTAEAGGLRDTCV